MPRLRWTRLLSLAIVSAMPLGVLAPACTSGNTSTIGQHITCTDTGAGVTNCHPTPAGTTGSGSDTCEDVDEDGDGTPHDVGEDHHGTVSGSGGSGTTAGSAGDDDDGDGIPNDRDCDKRPGGDDDGTEGSGSDSGSDSGSGHA